jgi:hypothetical protein
MSRLARVFQILCLLADRTIGIKSILASGPHRPGKGHMMLQPAFFAQDHAGVDDTIGTHNGAGSKLRARINNAGCVNLDVAHQENDE